MPTPDGILWISEARVQELCRVKRPTWKSWVQAGLIEEDPGGAYDEQAVLEIALIGSLREHLSPHDARAAWNALKLNGRREELLVRARELREDERFDLVIEPESRAVRLAVDDGSLVHAVRHPEDPRLVLVVSLADRLRRIRDGFRTIATPRRRPQQRKVGRPARDEAEVLPMSPRLFS